MSEFGIPYMGSKAKIAKSICMMLPKSTHFYDLFGGGFSMTHCMMKKYPHKYSHFHYNEIKSDVVDLVKRAIKGEFNYSRFKPPWVSREEFFLKKDSDAYIRCLWSFGNGQKTYLFGEHLESGKRSAHQAIVFDEFDDYAEKILGFSKWPVYAKTITQRRIYWRQKIAFLSKDRSPMLELQQLQQLEQLQQLQQLQQLEQLEQLEQLQQLSFYSGDYRSVEILPNSVVYCDIPYAGTAEYGGGFSHKEFFDWASSRDFPVYISEYNVSDPRFKLVYSIDKYSMLDNTKAKKTVKSEKLYWNGKGILQNAEKIRGGPSVAS